MSLCVCLLNDEYPEALPNWEGTLPFIIEFFGNASDKIKMDEERKTKWTESHERDLDDLLVKNCKKMYLTDTFEHSGWVKFHHNCAWICVLVGLFVFLTSITAANLNAIYGAFRFLCVALLSGSFCWFAAHIVELQEKSAHHVMVTSIIQ